MTQQPTPGVVLLLLLFLLAQCGGQENSTDANVSTTPADQPIVGGGCDGCELMFKGMPAGISNRDTSVGWASANPRFVLRGKIFQRDGVTPAAGILLYYWHTDAQGYYAAEGGKPDRRNPHGRLRGWLQTGSDGTYTIYTLRPAPYPGGGNPAHIHFSVKEPRIANPYYIDDVVFEGDPHLTADMKRQMQDRGGSGVLQVTTNGNVQTATRDIILGKNIPNYPAGKKSK
jgi:protocatechuate 3,4-dioxygenase beta subunit